MREYRFIGLDSFTEEDKEIFFERETVVEQIFKTSFFENITVVYANAGVGKTSLLKAGLLPKLKQNNENEPFLIKIDNFINNSERSLLDLITNKVKKNYPKNSFLDKILTPDDSLWYLFKRIESTENKVIFLIIDQFENIFSYPENQRLQIKNELYELIYEQIPVRFRAEVNEFLTENPNILTEKGIKKLYEKINIRLIISIRQDKLNMLDFFNDKIHKISQNKVEIPQLTIEQVSSIFKKTSSFVPKYNIDDKFVSQPFIVSHKLTEEIIEFLTKNNSKKIEAYQVQIIGAEIEKIATENKSKVVDSSLIGEISILYKSYYESIIEKIQNSRQEISARKFIENELIFEYENRKLTIYEGLAKQKYELDDSTIDFLIENQLIVATENENHDRFLELSHDALITPVLLAKEKRIHQEIRIEEELKKKKQLENAKKLQEEKTIRNRKIAIFFSVLFVFALALGIFAFWQRNNAIRSEKIANSTMYASYSFHFLETNPTLSYRLAEQAYNVDNDNIITQKAFFCSFYKTNIFYQNIAKFDFDIDKAIFSPNGEILLLITDKNYIIISKSGRKIHESSKDRDILSAIFTSDNKYLILSTSDSSIFFVDTVGNTISKIKMNSLVRSVSVSPDNLHLVAGCTDNNLYVFDNQNELISILKGHSGEVINCSFSDDGQKIVSTGLDNKIIVWDISGEILASHTNVVEKGFESGIIELACFSPESQSVLYVMNDYYHQNYLVKIWDWNKNEIISKLDFFTTDISSAQFISDNQVLITAQNKAYISDFTNQQNRMLIGHTKLIFDTKFDAKNDVIYTVSLDKTIKSWKIFNYSQFLNKFKFVDAVSISNSSSIYSFFADNKLDVFSASKNYFSKIPKSSVLTINFSENDNFITTTNIDSSFTLWEKDGKIRTNIKLKNSVLYAEYSEMQNSIIVVTSNSVYFYKPDSTLVNTIDVNEINHFDVSFEQNVIAYVDGNKLFIEGFDGNVIISETFENLNKVKFFDNGKKLMLSSNEAIYLSDKKFENFKEIITPKSTLADISNSGNFIVWADNENNCRLLNNKGEEIYNFSHNNYIVDIQFSPNEKTLITKTVDNFGKSELNLWFISISDIVEYMNDIKLFGEVYNPDIEELRKISNQEGSNF